ncbi:tetratricopeptide repeat protein [Micromonospora yasonensis]|uniref:tetratricopeptide repeat protein n=1 Tax=Micromonospora yasonensis TaxID=1128667 RepID=UPI00222FD367|nr:tetratricopeptide repeat protein [Micromonospora yasonensis]MCW3839743.1 tetratricopeptide repeat protein [Micromonospora yasonensis]
MLLLAGVVLLVGTPIVSTHLPREHGSRSALPGATTGGSASDSTVAAAQRRLKRLPNDWVTWAQLGSAYVQQARITADPSYYPKADGALRRSLELESATNWQAMAGMAALANARHDFTAARDWGHRAEALNPHGGSVHGVLVDALTQLGDYEGARTQLQRMLDVEPGVSSFTRASYDFEQHGQVAEARDALNRALAEATTPADRAFCRYYLGELAFNNGDPQEALRQYAAGITADPTYQQLYAGRGKARAALGQTTDALADYARAVQARPLPELLIEYGDLLAATGQPTQARQQYDLVNAVRQLSAANGVSDHLTAAAFLADHDQAAEALSEAQAEWNARHSVLTADALAWALHCNGRNAEALEYSLQATRLGWRNATLYYHQGAIRHALGDHDQARADLSRALEINPHFDVIQAPVARHLLDTLGGGR